MSPNAFDGLPTALGIIAAVIAVLAFGLGAWIF